MQNLKFFSLAALTSLSLNTFASETLFGYMYTTDTTPEKSWEYEQVQTLRSGKARGSYNALDLRNEFEYGITGNFQVAFYLNSSYLNSTNQYDNEDVSVDVPNHNEFNVNGASVEFMYRFLSPYKDGMGLGLYVEPEMSLRDKITGEDKLERAIETRLLLQKNFFDDTLVIASNIMMEPEWEKIAGTSAKELFVEFNLGANYRFKDKWFVGIEGRNHMEFPEFNLGHQEHSAFFAGPTLHYGSEAYWWTLTLMPQVWGWPRDLGTGADGRKIADSNLHLQQHEKFEVRLRFGIPLGEDHKHVH